jgi:hypothetical protein
MTASGEFDARPVRAFLPGPDLRVDESAWPASVPAMAQVPRQGLELPAGLTVVRGIRPASTSWTSPSTAFVYLLPRAGGADLRVRAQLAVAQA